MVLISERFADNARLQSAAENSPPMRKGEEGEPVQVLQQALIDSGFPMPVTTSNGTQQPDGIYGNETVNTVYKFQMKNGLQCDGVAGKETLHRLDALFPKKQAIIEDVLPPNPRLWSVQTCRTGDGTPRASFTGATGMGSASSFRPTAVANAPSALPYDPTTVTFDFRQTSAATAGANTNYHDPESRFLSTILHLSNRYGGGYPPRDWAFEVTGAVDLVSGASLAGWDFGFTQLQTVKNVTFEYGGAAAADGSVRITVHEPPALPYKSQRDSREDCPPWTKVAPRFTVKGSRIECVTGDHPTCKTPNKLRNRQTKCDNFLWRILDSRQFTTILTAQNPQGSFFAIGYFEWILNQVAVARWRKGVITMTLQNPGIRFADRGKRWDKDANSFLVATLGTISGNAALQRAILTAVLTKPAQNYAESSSRIAGIPDDFYTN